MNDSKSLIKNTSTLILIISGLFLSEFYKQKKPRPNLFISKQNAATNFNYNFLSKISLGNKRLFSSSLWISTILQSDEEHYKAKDLNSWMFLRFDTISKLEPKFLNNYLIGGIYLEIVKDDLSGATIIYERGLENYPDNLDLLKEAGFHFYYEIKDLNKAYPLYKKLAEREKNIKYMNTYSKILSSNGDKQLAYELLKRKYDELEDKENFIAKKIKINLYSLKAEIDLICLNNKKNLSFSCSSKDLDNNNYIFDGNSYKALKKWNKFEKK